MAGQAPSPEDLFILAHREQSLGRIAKSVMKQRLIFALTFTGLLKIPGK